MTLGELRQQLRKYKSDTEVEFFLCEPDGKDLTVCRRIELSEISGKGVIDLDFVEVEDKRSKK